MKELTVEVGFTTDCMGEVSSIKLEFSDNVLESIRKYQAYVKDNSDVFKVVMDFDAELLDSDGNETEFFRTYGGELFIFQETLYYFTQSKYDASVQIESNEFQLTDILTEEEYDDFYRSSLTCNECASDVDLCECGVLNVKNARKLLKEEGHFVENLWCSGDIIGTGENMDIEISEEQALEIMELMGRRHDATIGVNWDFIETIIEEYFNNK